MFNKKITCFFIILLLIILSIGVVSANDNTTQISSNETTTQINTEKTFKDIQIAINSANEKDTVELDGEYISSGEYIEISKSITLQGKTENTILNGNNTSRIFQINSNDVTLNLKNLKIINSQTKPEFINHEEELYSELFEYSAIYGKSSSTVNIFNSSFENNIGQIISSGTCHCTNTNFINNTNLNSEKIYTNNLINANKFYLHECIFINNYVKEILIKSHLIEIYDCNFANTNLGKNYTPILILGDGFYGGKNIILNTQFINNNACSALLYNLLNENIINNTTFINNSEGITLKGENHIINSKFENNRDGIYLDVYRDGWEPWYTYENNGKLVNCTFNSNIGKFGAVLSHTNLKVVDCDFTNNSGEYAGAITIRADDKQVYIKTAEIVNTTFKNNTQSAIVATDMHAKLLITNGNVTKNYESNVILDDSLNTMQLINVTTSKINTVFNSGDKLKIKLINKFTKNPVENSKITLKIYTGTKYKNYYSTTNSKGIATFQASTLNIGSHKVEIIFNHGVCSIPKTTTTIKVTKAKTTVKAPKVTNKYKKSKYFKVTIKHKTTKKAVKNTYVKIKIDKKTYKVKTNSKGIAKINTKKLKIGKHKVVISSGNTNYQISAKSSITIKR